MTGPTDPVTSADVDLINTPPISHQIVGNTNASVLPSVIHDNYRFQPLESVNDGDQVVVVQVCYLYYHHTLSIMSPLCTKHQGQAAAYR